MSSYEDYDLKSRVYDKTRSAIGSEIILKLLSRSIVPLDRQVVLDAGCGTGLYTAALKDRVMHLESVDLNAGMLGVAESRMKPDVVSGRIRFHQASITDLPLPENSMDAVMVNQVLHHLSDDPSAGWPAHLEAIHEFARVLKPGGSLIINSCSPVQMEMGFWFYKLIPDAMELAKEKIIDLETLDELLTKCGFMEIHREIHLELVLQGDSYFDPEGLLDLEWRAGDSIWSLVTKDNLAEVLVMGEELQAKGELFSFMRRHDRSRAKTGQITFTCARKEVERL